MNKLKQLLSVAAVTAGCLLPSLATAETWNDGNVIWRYFPLEGSTTEARLGDGSNACVAVTAEGNLTLPDQIGSYKVTTLSANAFAGCVKVTGVTLPENLEDVEDGAFDGASALKSIDVSKRNANLLSVDGVLYAESGWELVRVPEGLASEEFGGLVYPQVEVVRAGAFRNCAKIRKIAVSADSVGALMECTFAGCSSFDEFVWVDYMPSCVKDGALYFDENLCELAKWPTAKPISEFESIVLTENSDFFVDDGAFAGNPLEKITIPAWVQIRGLAFCDCPNLKDIGFLGSADWSFGALYDLKDVGIDLQKVRYPGFPKNMAEGWEDLFASLKEDDPDYYGKVVFEKAADPNAGKTNLTIPYTDRWDLLEKYDFATYAKDLTTLTFDGPSPDELWDILDICSNVTKVVYSANPLYRDYGYDEGLDWESWKSVIDWVTTDFVGVQMVQGAVPATPQVFRAVDGCLYGIYVGDDENTGEAIWLSPFWPAPVGELKIPEGVYELGEGALFGLDQVTKLVLPDSLTWYGDIDESAGFETMTQLAEFEGGLLTCCASPSTYYSQNGCLYCDGRLFRVPPAYASDVLVLDGWDEPYENALVGCRTIRSLTVCGLEALEAVLWGLDLTGCDQLAQFKYKGNAKELRNSGYVFDGVAIYEDWGDRDLCLRLWPNARRPIRPNAKTVAVDCEAFRYLADPEAITELTVPRNCEDFDLCWLAEEYGVSNVTRITFQGHPYVLSTDVLEAMPKLSEIIYNPDPHYAADWAWVREEFAGTGVRFTANEPDEPLYGYELEIWEEDDDGNILNGECYLGWEGCPFVYPALEGSYEIPERFENCRVVWAYGNAFGGMSNLTEVVFPQVFKGFDADVFSDCTSLEKLVFRGRCPNDLGEVLELTPSIREVDYYDSPFILEDGDFVWGDFIAEFKETHPESDVEFVALTPENLIWQIEDDYRLWGEYDPETGLRVPCVWPDLEGEATVPSEVKYIGEDSFACMSNLTALTFPGALEQIDAGVATLVKYKTGEIVLLDPPRPFSPFVGCTSLAKLTFYGDCPGGLLEALEQTPSVREVYYNDFPWRGEIGWTWREFIAEFQAQHPESNVRFIALPPLEEPIYAYGLDVWERDDDGNILDGECHLGQDGHPIVYPGLKGVCEIPERIENCRVVWADEDAFVDMRELMELVLPQTFGGFDGNVFSGCTSLVKLTFNGIYPEGLDEVLEQASSVREVYYNDFPWSGMSGWTWREFIAEFRETHPESSVEFVALPPPEEPIWNIVDGGELYGEYDPEAGWRVPCVWPDLVGEATVPSNVYAIGEHAFACMSNLTAMTLPASVTSIDPLAFVDCVSLKKLVILGAYEPDGLWELREAMPSVEIVHEASNWHEIGGGCVINLLDNAYEDDDGEIRMIWSVEGDDLVSEFGGWVGLDLNFPKRGTLTFEYKVESAVPGVYPMCWTSEGGDYLEIGVDGTQSWDSGWRKAGFEILEPDWWVNIYMDNYISEPFRLRLRNFKWTDVPETVTITLDPRLGKLPDGQAAQLTLRTDGTFGELPVPVRESCEFIGWSRYVWDEPVEPDTPAPISDTTLVAQWNVPLEAAVNPNGDLGDLLFNEDNGGWQVGAFEDDHKVWHEYASYRGDVGPRSMAEVLSATFNGEGTLKFSELSGSVRVFYDGWKDRQDLIVLVDGELAEQMDVLEGGKSVLVKTTGEHRLSISLENWRSDYANADITIGAITFTPAVTLEELKLQQKALLVSVEVAGPQPWSARVSEAIAAALKAVDEATTRADVRAAGAGGRGTIEEALRLDAEDAELGGKIPGSELVWEFVDGTLYIDGEGTMPALTRETAPWSKSVAAVESVSIGKDVLSVCDGLFSSELSAPAASVIFGTDDVTIPLAAFVDADGTEVNAAATVLFLKDGKYAAPPAWIGDDGASYASYAAAIAAGCASVSPSFSVAPATVEEAVETAPAVVVEKVSAVDEKTGQPITDRTGNLIDVEAVAENVNSNDVPNAERVVVTEVKGLSEVARALAVEGEGVREVKLTVDSVPVEKEVSVKQENQLLMFGAMTETIENSWDFETKFAEISLSADGVPVHDSPGLIKISIPHVTRGRTSFSVARIHNGKVQLFREIVDEADAADLTFMIGDGKIDLWSEKFSDYAIGSMSVETPVRTVTFDANGGSVSETNRCVDSGSAVGGLPTATRTGHAFLGWFTEADGGTPVTSETVVKADVTFYAQWKANAYEVRFDPNGGVGTMSPQAFVYGEPQVLCANAFARKGWEFAGWATRSDAGSAAYANGAAVNNLTAAAGGVVTLYAVWKNIGPAVFCEIAAEYRTKADVGVIPVEVVNVGEAVKIAVKGLPSGVKFTAKDVKATAKSAAVSANSIYGAPTKSGVYAATVTVTPTDKKSKMAPIVKGLMFVVRNAGEHIVRADCDAAQGTVKGMGVYAKGKKVTLKATAVKGYVFSGWYDGDALVSRLASYVLTMPDVDVNLMARFVTVVADKGSIALAVTAGETDIVQTKSITVKLGMPVEWPVAASALSATTVKVSGLPSGLKFTAKDVMKKGSKTEVDVPANTIYGTPKTASKTDKNGNVTPSKVKITVTTAGKSKQEYVFNVTVRGIPAEGTFNGGGENGLVTLTVAKTGKLSGKYLADGNIWTLSAAGFDTWDDDDRMTATLTAKSGKEVETLALVYENGYFCASLTSGQETGRASPIVGAIAPLFEAWRNEWKDSSKKTLAASFKGQKVQVGEVLLTVGANGAVTAKGAFVTGFDEKKQKDITYSASCSTVLIPMAEAGWYKIYLYFPPKAGKFEGRSGKVILRWNGTAFVLE